tara:strand:+ start:416 stop:670 length:255 start_codon:yes stop_codon:yes gene_type:complete
MISVEWIGYLAQSFILLSFLVSNLKVLRIVNIIGGIGWTSYGLYVGSSSIIIGNILMILIHIFKLYQEIKLNKRDNELDNSKVS